MPFQQHIDVSPACIFSTHFIKCTLNVLRCYHLSRLCCFLKPLQYLPLLGFRQCTVIPSVLALCKAFYPFGFIFPVLLVNITPVYPQLLRRIRRAASFIAHHQYPQPSAYILVPCRLFRRLDRLVFCFAYLESLHFSSPIPLYHYLLVLSISYLRIVLGILQGERKADRHDRAGRSIQASKRWINREPGLQAWQSGLQLFWGNAIIRGYPGRSCRSERRGRDR